MHIPRPVSDAPSLSKEALMAHMRRLCQAPRPPASPEEYQAGEYVKEALAKLGYPAPGEQAFKSHNSIGWISIPTMVSGALALPVAAVIGGLWGRVAGIALLLMMLVGLWRMMTAAPPLFKPLVTWWRSRNLFLSIPPAGEPKRRVFLVGHLDSQKQRFLTPIPWLRYQNAYMASGVGLVVILLVVLIEAVYQDWVKLPGWLWGIEGLMVLSLLGFLNDERQPHIIGANDNATAVSVLLGMAGALREHPLQNTEVTLLFTGCEEVPCAGMEAYLAAHEGAISKEDSYWIDLEMVGTGRLCYITRHGMSALAQYYPHTVMACLASQAAEKYPHLGVTGKAMLILEEVANLRRRGYQAICIAGYNEQGFLPNWHRLSDNLENIEPETLERAARYTWALVQEVDCIEAD